MKPTGTQHRAPACVMDGTMRKRKAEALSPVVGSRMKDDKHNSHSSLFDSDCSAHTASTASFVAFSDGAPTHSNLSDCSAQSHQSALSISSMTTASLDSTALEAIESLCSESTPSYFPSTRVPVEGWFQPCRYCSSWTAYSLCTSEGQELPVCRRCSERLMGYYQDYLRQQLQNGEHLPSLKMVDRRPL